MIKVAALMALKTMTFLFSGYKFNILSQDFLHIWNSFYFRLFKYFLVLAELYKSATWVVTGLEFF